MEHEETPGVPTIDESVDPMDNPSVERRKKPRSVITVLAILLTYWSISFVLGLIAVARDLPPGIIVKLFVYLCLGGLVIWGVFARHRLSWQWGRLLALLAAILLTAPLVLRRMGAPGVSWGEVIVGILAASMYTIFFCLGRRSAKEYFRLICPRCGRATKRAADFVFNRARCADSDCGNVW